MRKEKILLKKVNAVIAILMCNGVISNISVTRNNYWSYTIQTNRKQVYSNMLLQLCELFTASSTTMTISANEQVQMKVDMTIH